MKLLLYRFVLMGLAIVLGLAAASGSSRADEGDEVGPELEAQLHLKILSYDRNLRLHTNGRVVVGVLYRADNSESQHVGVAMVAAFQSRGRKSPVQGLPVLAVPIAFDPKTVQKRIQENGVTAVYVTPGL